MTVTELREALQKLEAEGKGALTVVHWGDHYRASSPELQEIDDVDLTNDEGAEVARLL